MWNDTIIKLKKKHHSIFIANNNNHVTQQHHFSLYPNSLLIGTGFLTNLLTAHSIRKNRSDYGYTQDSGLSFAFTFYVEGRQKAKNYTASLVNKFYVAAVALFL